ncbi:hypothetical protein PaecuDRAFT_2032 [Paenibacillus curdlanolyticus YK9]|uniref:Uncharacterized protein n=1 Tax=Paenibacillus curdlanolyticus YK9 TaxID=717606 RepID=E0I8Q4_9BACL|nr:hypothetical protein [Paenibacillus curdlanolyticus]EFM10788.1 hypothetical protein PaecuDRAFT_2032 [Paenibacillus curdlanolyticus YK9]
MMRTAFHRMAIIALFIVGAFALPTDSAHAGFFSRVQDIYHAPDKISEMEQQYKDANEALTKQLEEARQAADQLAQRQEELTKQNEQLMEQNASLQSEVKEARQKKADLQKKLIMASASIAALLIAYFMAIRIWRYASWRRQRHLRDGGIEG